MNGIIAGKPRRGITRYLRYGGFIVWLHYLTVEEMMRRGARHTTPIDTLWNRIPVDRRRFNYPLRPAVVRQDIAVIAAKIADPRYRCKMNNASLPISACGMQLIEAQTKLVLENRLPVMALAL